jgi:hypothetical protein
MLLFLYMAPSYTDMYGPFSSSGGSEILHLSLIAVAD